MRGHDYMNAIQFRMDAVNEVLLTRGYTQFIKDNKTVPSMEVVKSSHVTVKFLEDRYNNALKSVKNFTLRKCALIKEISLNKDSCLSVNSDLSLKLPNEIVLQIIQNYHQINVQSNLTFEYFHCPSRLLEWKFSDEVLNYFEIMDAKKMKEGGGRRAVMVENLMLHVANEIENEIKFYNPPVYKSMYPSTYNEDKEQNCIIS